MRKALTLLIVLAVTLTVALAGCKSDEGGSGVTEDTVKLGLFVSTSGAVSTYGIDTKNGVDLAIEEINDAGGINGKKIDLVFVNTNSKEDEARAAASQLATRDKVLVAMGAVASGLSLQAKPVFQEHGIPMVSPASTSPKVTQDAPNVFRICYLDDFQGGACAVFAYNDMKAREVAILYNQSNDYSKGLSQHFKAKFTKLGGEIIEEEAFKEGDTDFSSQVTAIGDGADVVFVPGYYGNVSLIAKEFRKQGIDTPLLGGDGWESAKLIPNAGDALEGCYFGNHYSQQDEREVVQNFIESYKEEYGAAPSSLAALGYDVVYVVKKAIEESGGFDRAKIIEALGALEFEGVTGSFRIVGEGDAKKAISILRIEGDKFVPVRQIKPDEVE